jgi:AcrR family transcriptional regulator
MDPRPPIIDVVTKPRATQRRTQGERVAESSRRLIEATIELVAEQGYERTTAADISRRAGYSRAMAHKRYGSKEALLDEIMGDYEQSIGAEAIDGASGLEQIIARIDNLGDVATVNPQFTRAMFVLQFEALGMSPTLRERVTDWLQRLGDTVESAVRAGHDDGSVSRDVDPKCFADDLKSMLIGTAYLWALSPDTVDLTARLQHARNQVRERLLP